MNSVEIRDNVENKARKKKNRISRLFSNITSFKRVEEKISQPDNISCKNFGSQYFDNLDEEAEEETKRDRMDEDARKLSLTEEETNFGSTTSPSITDSEFQDKLTLAGSYQDWDNAEFLPDTFNIDELYTEILYVILHNVGCDISDEIIQAALFSYAQEAFKISNQTHDKLLEIAKNKAAPKRMINVEVIEGIELKAKDPNGTSDPFVIVYLASNRTLRYKTTVKSMTLNPVWEEHFTLPITEKSTYYDELCLEVRDCDAAETVKEKMGKIRDVKGVKGMKILVKELAVTAARGQRKHELIGRVKILLNTIPASGMKMSYPLEKKDKEVRQGILKVKISFSSSKNAQIAEQEHRHIRRMVLLHELELSQVAPYWWCGNFSSQGKQLLTQHIAQSGLSEIKVALCSYSVYALVHEDHPLNLSLFLKLLEELMKPLSEKLLTQSKTKVISEKDIKLFWEATKKLLPSCFNIIRKIRTRTSSEQIAMKQVIEVLKILRCIFALGPKDVNLFPIDLYPWITYQGDEPNCDVRRTLNDAVSLGASDWFDHIIENVKKSDDTTLSRIQYLIQIIKLVRGDLEKANQYYDKLFVEYTNFQYAKCLYVFYQAKLATLCEPEVLEICNNLKGLYYEGYNFHNGVTDTDSSEDSLGEGTSLFELYLAIQRFGTVGQGLCPADYNGFYIKNFYQWFRGGVVHWLNIAVYKALGIIEKAVEVDELVHVDSFSKWSSSAVDTLAIFYEVKVFWQQLNWPDIEDCYTFIEKIIDDICRCCLFYANKIFAKVECLEEAKNTYEKIFEISTRWSLIINNVEHVWESLELFTQDLGMKDVIKQKTELKKSLEGQNNIISNGINTVKNKIIELIKIVVNKMFLPINKLLMDGAELNDQRSSSIHNFMTYVDNNLETLHKELKEEHFDRALEFFWIMLSNIYSELTQSSLERRRPPSFFAFLRKSLNCILSSFNYPENKTVCDALTRTEQILRINGLETADLIHEVHLELVNKFEQLKESPFGEITFRCKVLGDTVKIELINARNLAAMNSHGTCDSFVKIHLLPEHKFGGIEKLKTKTHNKTLFPLYDETITINLSPEQRDIEDGLILLSVKDKNKLSYNNQYIGEAFIRFKDIPNTSEPLSSLPQVKKWLSRPTSLDTDAIKTLETRLNEKQAKEFLKKFKQKMV